jgi:hypothetical protein
MTLNQIMFVRLSFLQLCPTLLSSGIPLARSGTSTEDITYVLPIWEGSLTNHTRSNDLAVLSTMKSSWDWEEHTPSLDGRFHHGPWAVISSERATTTILTQQISITCSVLPSLLASQYWCI